MVNKKPKTEYMKKFKDPKWEVYGKCYEELLRYRLGRRLWEQAHNPWYWDGWENGSDTSSSGRVSPRGRPEESESKPGEEGLGRAGGKVTEGRAEEEVAEEGEPERWRTAEEDMGSTKPHASESQLQGPGEEPKGDLQSEDNGDLKKLEPKKDRPHSHPKQRQTRRTASPKGRSAHKSSSPLRVDTGKERHPFALYGWAEKPSEMAHKRTYNVCPAASTNEIHESAIRAKNRRQIEKRMRMQERQRARSLEKISKTKSSTVENPWLSEYMRCFSARTR